MNYFFQTTFKPVQTYGDYLADDEFQKSSKEVFIIALISYVVLLVIVSPIIYLGEYFIESFRFSLVPQAAAVLIGFLLRIAGVFLLIQVLTQTKPDLYKVMGLIGMSFLPVLMASFINMIINSEYYFVITFAGLAGNAVVMGLGLKQLFELSIEKAMIGAFAVLIILYFLMDYVYDFVWGGF